MPRLESWLARRSGSVCRGSLRAAARVQSGADAPHLWSREYELGSTSSVASARRRSTHARSRLSSLGRTWLWGVQVDRPCRHEFPHYPEPFNRSSEIQLRSKDLWIFVVFDLLSLQRRWRTDAWAARRVPTPLALARSGGRSGQGGACIDERGREAERQRAVHPPRWRTRRRRRRGWSAWLR